MNIAELKAKLAELVKALEGAETLDAARKVKADIDDVQAKIELLEEKSHILDGLKADSPVKAKDGGRARSLGEHFVKYRESHPDQENRIVATPFAAKAAGDPTVSTGLSPVGYDLEPVRRVAEPLSVLDLFGRKSISQPVYSWNAYSSTDGAVGVTAEGATKNKLTYHYVPKTANLQKVTGFIKVTEELFDDAAYIVDAINQDLVDDLDANRQAQAVATLLGTSGLMTDTATVSNDVDIFKAILKAAADIEDSTHIAADAVVVTPAIWLRLRSSLDENGRFYAGEPFGDSEYNRLFEMTFVKNADVTANHIIVGAFRRGAELVSKSDGIRVDSTNSNDVDFEKNLISIRAEAREILAVKRPGCFCNITVTSA